MGNIRGMLSLDELAQRVKEDQIETVVLAFSDHYGRLLGKRFAAEYFVAEAAQRGSHACNYLLTTDMEMTPVPGYRFASWERGYGDFHLVPDLNTLRLASWLEKSALVLADVEDEETHRPVSVAPRSILRRQLAAVGDLGYSVNAASELEYYLYRDSYQEAATKGYARLQAFWLVPRGLSPPAGHARGGFHRRGAPPPRALWHPRRKQQGRMWPGAA